MTDDRLVLSIDVQIEKAKQNVAAIQAALDNLRSPSQEIKSVVEADLAAAQTALAGLTQQQEKSTAQGMAAFNKWAEAMAAAQATLTKQEQQQSKAAARAAQQAAKDQIAAERLAATQAGIDARKAAAQAKMQAAETERLAKEAIAQAKIDAAKVKAAADAAAAQAKADAQSQAARAKTEAQEATAAQRLEADRLAFEQKLSAAKAAQAAKDALAQQKLDAQREAAELRLQQMRLSLLKQEEQAANQRRIPYFLQFAFFPFADLARTFGAPGVAQGLMAAGSIFGIVDQLGPMADGFRLLSQDLQKMGNIIGPVATRIATATAGFGPLGSAIATVGLVAAPAAAALIGVVAVIAEIQRRAEEAAKAGRDLAAREINVANIIASGATTQEVTQQRDEAQNLLNLTNQQTSGLAVLQVAVANALQQQATYAQAVAQTQGRQNELTQAYDLATQRVAELLEETRQYTGVQVTQSNVMTVLNAAVEEANTSLTQMETDVQAYNIALASGALAANDARAAQEEAIKAAEEFGQALREDIAAVLNAVREEQTRRNQSYLDAVEASVKAQEELIKAQNDAAEAAQEHSDKVRAIQEDYAEKARDAEKKLADNRQKIAEDNAKAIAKIEREFSRSYADAIANRDAVAAAKAIQRRADELADLEEARQEQQKALSRAYEDALQAAREAQAKALRQEQERYAKELTTVQRAQQLALVAVQNAKNAEVAIYQNRMLSIVGIAGIGLNTVQLQFSRMFASIIMMADRTAQLIPQLMARYQYGQYRAGERGSYGMSVQQIVDQRMMQIFGGGQLGGGGAGFYVRTR